jgi:hypothetical protein
MKKHNKPLEIPRMEQERMFGFWCEGGRNYAKTARHFNRAITTLRKIASLQQWAQRAEEIDEKIRKRIDDRIVTNEFSNIRLVRILKKKMAKQLFEKPDLEVTIRDFIALLRYEDELMGNLSDGDKDAGDRHYHFDFSDVSDAGQDQIRRNITAAWPVTTDRF